MLWYFGAEFREKRDSGDVWRSEAIGKKAARGIVASAVYLEMREMHTVQGGARGGATRGEGDDGVLPGGLEMQMWQ